MNPPEVEAFLVWLIQADQGDRAAVLAHIRTQICIDCGHLILFPGEPCDCPDGRRAP